MKLKKNFNHRNYKNINCEIEEENDKENKFLYPMLLNFLGNVVWALCTLCFNWVWGNR